MVDLAAAWAGLVMPHILMVLSDIDESPRTVDFALTLAEQQGGTVIGLFVMDPKAAQRMDSQLSDSGFVGDQPSQQVMRVIEGEYRDQAKKQLAEAARTFANQGIPFEAELRDGDFTQTCLDVIRERHVDHVVICGRHQSNIRKILFGSAAMVRRSYIHAVSGLKTWFCLI